MTTRSSKRSHTPMPLPIHYRCAISAGITICVGLLLLLLSTVIAYVQADPAAIAKPLALVSIYASTVIGGYIAARGTERPILSATITGIGVALILLFLSLAPWGKSGTAPSPLIASAMYFSVIATSAAGGWIGTKKRKKRVSHHTHRRHK